MKVKVGGVPSRLCPLWNNDVGPNEASAEFMVTERCGEFKFRPMFTSNLQQQEAKYDTEIRQVAQQRFSIVEFVGQYRVHTTGSWDGVPSLY